jgi:hypothetical protein
LLKVAKNFTIFKYTNKLSQLLIRLTTLQIPDLIRNYLTQVLPKGVDRKNRNIPSSARFVTQATEPLSGRRFFALTCVETYKKPDANFNHFLKKQLEELLLDLEKLGLDKKDIILLGRRSSASEKFNKINNSRACGRAGRLPIRQQVELLKELAAP